MSTNNQNNHSRSPVKKVFNVCATIILISVLGFYANKTVQSYLGQQAIDNSGLALLTLDQALKVANNTNKLVLADMSAIWCPACRKLDQQVFSDKRVKIQLNQYFVYARIKYESAKGKRFMQKYHVTGFPTLLVLNAQGEKLIQLPINYKPLPFLATLQKVVEESR